MRGTSLGRLVAATVLLALIAPPATAGASVPAPVSSSVPTLAPEVIAAALKADARKVRRDGDVTVEAVRIGARLRAMLGADTPLYRLTIEGGTGPGRSATWSAPAASPSRTGTRGATSAPSSPSPPTPGSSRSGSG